MKEKLKKLKESKEGALAMFATAGDPDFDTSKKVFGALGRGGADIIEIGIPYSDPLMDGPVLQLSYQRALGAGFKLNRLPSLIESVRADTGVPSLVMTCYNPVLQYGPERFFRDISNAGASAILLTDLPPEEWDEKREAADSLGLGTIFLVTPTSTDERMKFIDTVSSPFVYCVSKIGITGEGSGLPPTLKEYIDRVRRNVTKPVLVGFGITKPEDAAMIGGLADGIVVGSALVKIVEKNIGDTAAMLKSAEEFTGALKAALIKKNESI